MNPQAEVGILALVILTIVGMCMLAFVVCYKRMQVMQHVSAQRDTALLEDDEEATKDFS